MGYLKKFSQFGPAVWPAIANIYINIYISALLLAYRAVTGGGGGGGKVL